MAACSVSASDSNDDAQSPPSSSGTSSNAGSYRGTYTGSDTGTVTMTVSGSNVDVVATVAGKEYPASGSIGSGGSIAVGLGAAEGVTVTFEGTFANGKGSGTWKSTIGGSGTWSVTR